MSRPFARAFFPAALTVLLLFPVPGFTQSLPVFVPDGQAVNRHPRVTDVLKRIASANRFDLAAARNFSGIVLAPGLTRESADLIFELLAAREPVRVAVEAETILVPAPDDAARAYLGQIKTIYAAPDMAVFLDSLWLKGPAEMRRLFDFYQLGGQPSFLIAEFAEHKLYEASQGSALDNQYKPLRDLLGTAATQLKATDPLTERQAKIAFYGWMMMVNRATDNAIPGDLFEWLKT
jgi:hypothetical protein